MTANLVEGTAENYAELTATGSVVVDIWAPWCSPCVAFAPTFEAAAAAHPKVTFIKVDADAQPTLAAELDVRSIPTVLFLRDGQLVHRSIGANTAAKFDELVADHT